MIGILPTHQHKQHSTTYQSGIASIRVHIFPTANPFQYANLHRFSSYIWKLNIVYDVST